MSKPHAIIIGAGPGVGLGVARAFAKEGFNLSLLSRNPEKIKDEVLGLIQQGTSANSIAADAGDHASLTQAIEHATKKFGDAEVLVFNVLAFSQGKPSTITPEGLTRDFHTNVSGGLAAVRAVLPSMLQRKSGTILFTGGGWAIYPAVEVTSVSIDKGALRTLALMLAEELKGTGVRVGTVTIMGAVALGTPFDPAKIGRMFVEAYRYPEAAFPVELQFKGV